MVEQSFLSVEEMDDLFCFKCKTKGIIGIKIICNGYYQPACLMPLCKKCMFERIVQHDSREDDFSFRIKKDWVLMKND